MDDNYVEVKHSTNRQGAETAAVVKLKGEWKELLTVPSLKINTFILALMATTASFCFYNFNFLMKNVEGSLIHNTMASATSELVGDLVSGVLYMKLGPRYAFSLSYAISFVGSICLILLMDSEQYDLLPFFIPLAKFGVAAAFNMCFIAAVQLIPTIFASTVFGISNVFARTITILAP